jgi:hypothetical protein
MSSNPPTVMVGRGQHVRPGEYKIVATSLKLVVTNSSASIVMLTGYPSSVVIELPLEGFVIHSPEDTVAREAVLSYVAAAWAYHQWPQVNEWMEAQEEREGLSVWRLKYCHEYEDSPPEPIRQLIEQEVTQWLQSHS